MLLTTNEKREICFEGKPVVEIFQELRLVPIQDRYVGRPGKPEQARHVCLLTALAMWKKEPHDRESWLQDLIDPEVYARGAIYRTLDLSHPEARDLESGWNAEERVPDQMIPYTFAAEAWGQVNHA